MPLPTWHSVLLPVVTTPKASLLLQNNQVQQAFLFSEIICCAANLLDVEVGITGLVASGLNTKGMISNPGGWTIGAGVLLYGAGTFLYDSLH